MKNKIFFTVILALLLISVPASPQVPVSFSLSAGANSPNGEFGDVYKAGGSLEGMVLYSTSFPGLDLTFSIGYNSFSYQNEYFENLLKKNLNNVTAVTGFYVDWTSAVIPVMAGGRFNLPDFGVKTYLAGEIGIHYMTFEQRFNGDRVLFSSSDPAKFDSTNQVYESASETGFGFTLGGGIQIPVAPALNLDLSVKYNYGSVLYSKKFEVFRNSNDKFTTPELKNITFLTIRGGFTLSL